MADEFETVELEYSEEDILYYLEDEDGNEVGFVIEDAGREVEYFYDDVDSDGLIIVPDDGETGFLETDDIIELEISENDISYYLVDEKGNEIGFVIEEDGREIECYYDEGDDGDDASGEGANDDSGEARVPERAQDHGYLYKMASIAGFEGGKARQKAEAQLDKVRDKAEVHVDKAKKVAEEQKDKAKAKADELDLGITREGVAEATSDLNAIAKEGAETAKELKAAYDDIMDSFGFMLPSKTRRR